jgi:hypothetical protein
MALSTRAAESFHGERNVALGVRLDSDLRSARI